MSKTHYRKVFKSDHLSVADLEDFAESGAGLVYTIASVKQEHGVAVAGRKGNFNIAYFKENIKPLVLNATNSKVMRKLSGSQWIEDWRDIKVQLYIDHDAKMGENIGGVRIHPRPPVEKKKPVLTPDNKNWAAAKEAFKANGIEQVLKNCTMSEKHQQQLADEVAAEQE